MKNAELLDLYSDYLISSFNLATATGMSKMLNELVSHDKISRFLGQGVFTQKDYWKIIKPIVRRIEHEDGVIKIDDTIEHKPHTTENDIICWHYDHSKGKSVKGINIISAFYHSCDDSLAEPVRLPIMYQLILKTVLYSVVKTKKTKRKSETTKNEILRHMVAQAIHNQLKFKYVLADSWFGSAENMRFIKKKKKFFIFDMKSNRNAVLNEKDRNKGQWSRIRRLSEVN